ncbi:unnamed protein product, partial [Amoebophrya sp. A120]
HLIKRRRGAGKRGALLRRPPPWFLAIWGVQKGARKKRAQNQNSETAWHGRDFGAFWAAAKAAAFSPVSEPGKLCKKRRR